MSHKHFVPFVNFSYSKYKNSLIVTYSIAILHYLVTINNKKVIRLGLCCAAFGVGTLELLADEPGQGEPSLKRYRMQAEDGQAYILTVAGRCI